MRQVNLVNSIYYRSVFLMQRAFDEREGLVNLTDKIKIICDKVSEWSLYIMILVLPFSISLVEIAIVTAIISFSVKKILAHERLFDKNVINVLLGVFLLASLISIFNSQYMALSIRAFFSKILKFAALFIITPQIINTRQKLNKFVIIALASSILILADAFIQFFFLHIDLLRGYPSFSGAPTASFPFPNGFAAWMLIFIFPVGAYLAFSKAIWSRKCASAVIFIAFSYFLIVSRARGAWLGFLGSLGFLAFLKPKMIGIILLVIIILGAGLVYKGLVPYAMSVTNINDRASIWQTGWEIFKEHPIIGNGVNTFFNKFKMERQDNDRGMRGSYAHNCYLQMACDTGILGLSAFFAFVAAVLIKGFRSLKVAKDPFLYSLILGIGLGLIAFLLHSAVDVNLYSLPLATLFWISSGVLLAVIKISESGLGTIYEQ